MEWMLLPLKRYAEFSGRSRRMEYWMFVVLQFLVNMALYVISLVLIHVVNRQSFHWSMDLSVPWSVLAVFSATLLFLAIATTVIAAREAMSGDAVRVGSIQSAHETLHRGIGVAQFHQSAAGIEQDRGAFAGFGTRLATQNIGAVKGDFLGLFIVYT